MNSLIEVTTTLGCQEDARTLASKLIAARLAACVQIDGPIESVYRWQGQVQCEPEWRCTMKSIEELQDKLLAFIDEHHPYDVPEILVHSVAGVSDSYAAWLQEQVGM